MVWDGDCQLCGTPLFCISYLAGTSHSCLTLQEKEKLTMLERRYHSITGGRPFPKTPPTLKEVMKWGSSSFRLEGVPLTTYGTFTPVAAADMQTFWTGET